MATRQQLINLIKDENFRTKLLLIPLSKSIPIDESTIIVHDAFTDVWNKTDKELEKIDNLENFLTTIVVNKTNKWFRENKYGKIKVIHSPPDVFENIDKKEIPVDFSEEELQRRLDEIRICIEKNSDHPKRDLIIYDSITNDKDDNNYIIEALKAGNEDTITAGKTININYVKTLKHRLRLLIKNKCMR